MILKKILFFGLLIFSLAFVALVVRPLPDPIIANCEPVTGTVVEIYGGGLNDAALKLKDDPVVYFINRGLEHGLTVEDLQNQLNQQAVTIYYLKHWTPLDRNGSLRYITRLEFKDEVMYNEIEDFK